MLKFSKKSQRNNPPNLNTIFLQKNHPTLHTDNKNNSQENIFI